MKWMYSKVNNKKGFTLIELIVVIAIIAILAAVAVPKLGGFTDSAKAKADMANAKLLDQVVQVYYADKGVFPTAAISDTTTFKPTSSEVDNLVSVLKTANYLPTNTAIVFNTIGKVSFTMASSTVTGVTYTP